MKMIIDYLANKDRLGAMLILLFSIGYLIVSQDIPLQRLIADSAFTPRTLPQLLGILSVVVCIGILLQPVTGSRLFTQRRYWGRLALFVVLMSSYGLMLRPAGFIVSSVLFLAGGAWILGERRISALIFVPGAVTLAFWVLMNLGLGVYLPPWPDGLNL